MKAQPTILARGVLEQLAHKVMNCGTFIRQTKGSYKDFYNQWTEIELGEIYNNVAIRH